jgi:hypothetical protein
MNACLSLGAVSTTSPKIARSAENSAAACRKRKQLPLDAETVDATRLVMAEHDAVGDIERQCAACESDGQSRKSSSRKYNW